MAVPNQFDQNSRDDNGYCDKKVSLPAPAIGKETEGCAFIPNVHPIKKRGDLNRLAVSHGLLYEPFNHLVGKRYQCGKAEKDKR
jgi:hypothetical protein